MSTADIVKAKPGPCPKRAGQDNIADKFAKLATEDLKATDPYCAGQLRGGVPTALWDSVLKMNFGRMDNSDTSLARLSNQSAEFDALWASYAKRLAAVHKAVADAAAQSSDPAKADATLRAVITQTKTFDSSGSLVSRDDFLVPGDAESEAIQALIASAKARGDLHTMFEMMPQAAVRRTVGDDAESQRLVYMADKDPPFMRALAPKTPKSIGLIQDEVAHKGRAMLGAAKQVYKDLVDSKQLVVGETYGKPNAKKGEWVQIKLPPDTEKKSGAGITNDKVDLVYQGVAYHPHDCKETDKIDYISPGGKVYWRVDCQYTEEKKPGKIKATLVGPMPETKDELWIIGKVKATAGGWDLEQARIYDLGYLDIPRPKKK